VPKAILTLLALPFFKNMQTFFFEVSMSWLNKLKEHIEKKASQQSDAEIKPEKDIVGEKMPEPTSGQVETELQPVVNVNRLGDPPPDADQELVDWFLSADLPSEPFELDQARRVTNPEAFYKALWLEIASRWKSPRWKCGATQYDLQALKTYMQNKMEIL